MDVTSYLLGKKAGGGTPAVLQDKEVTITTNGETEITADEGYTGLGKVDLTTNVQPNLESKSVTISTNTTTTITPTSGKDGLSNVEITTNVPQPSGKITITQNGTDIDVSSYASADVNVSGGGSTYDFTYLTSTYDSSCVGGSNHTTLTTSVKALNNNIVYAIITARSAITLSDNTWTLLKTEKCVGSGATQTTYIYYKKASSDDIISLTVNQSSNVRLFLSLLSMQYSDEPSNNLVSAELPNPTGTTDTVVNNMNLVDGDILILSTYFSNPTSSTDTFKLYNKDTLEELQVTKYATVEDEQRMTIFKIKENCSNLIIRHDNDQLTNTFCYIKMTPVVQEMNQQTLEEAEKQYYTERINYIDSDYVIQDTGDIEYLSRRLYIGDIKYTIKLRPGFNYTSFKNMFYQCRAKNIELTATGITGITTMQDMFYQCNNAETIILNDFDTSSVTNMYEMFYACNKLKELDLSNFDTSNVTSMISMFSGCLKLKELDLSNFDTSSLSTIRFMFWGCSSLEHLDIRTFNFANFSDTTNMFGISSSGYVPYNCEIIVADNTQKQWLNTNFSSYTNVKTVAEYEAE